MKIYWQYFKYVCEHKKNVGIECVKMGLFLHAITHDLSKFLPSEFFPYAKYFFGKYGVKLEDPKPWQNLIKQLVSDKFGKAWLLHQHRNKHHWDYWVNSEGKAIKMPKRYVKQMVADWRGMSKKFGGTASSFYIKNKETIRLHSHTRQYLEELLGVRNA